MSRIDPELLIRAYSVGVFPMAESREASEVHWVEPRRRGVLPLDRFHLSRSLAKRLRSDRYQVTADRDFAAVVAGCAACGPRRTDTWINPAIEKAYLELHRRGCAHSLEVWEGERLVGGLYGVSLGRAFFGESMFSRAVDASKVAMAHLVARLRAGGYTLLDCQFITDHLASLGAVEIDRRIYAGLLSGALEGVSVGCGSLLSFAGADFFALGRAPSTDAADTVSGPISGWCIVQLLGQTS